MTVTASELVATARAAIREVAPADCVALRPRPVLIDVREPAEFQEAHLPDAINLPRGVLEFQVDAHPAMGCATAAALADRHQPVLLYCRSGGRSALAAQSLAAMGFTDVRSVAGGIQAWLEARLPVVRP
ncbi:MAG: rhodanese-like domain-containing protein [Xanthomonadales bacterium]|nr:rhodanese-like domain-containing protein [Xanthomonadales bacterium]